MINETSSWRARSSWVPQCSPKLELRRKRGSPTVSFKINLKNFVSLKAELDETVHILEPVDVADLVTVSSEFSQMS